MSGARGSRWLAALVLVACGKKTEAPAPPVTAPPASAAGASLWALAPAEATYGMVFADHVPARLQTLVAELAHDVRVADIDGKPWARPVLAWVADAGGELELLDAAALARAGLDLERGAAVFQTNGVVSLTILPVADRAAYRAFSKRELVQVDGREVDRSAKSVCAPIGDRYACAPTSAALAAAAQPHTSRLATAVAALPAEARGDIELYIDVPGTPTAATRAARERDRIGAIDAVGLTYRFAPGHLTVHAWAAGALTGPVARALAVRAPAPELAALRGPGLRFAVDPSIITALGGVLPPLVVAGHDLKAELVEQLTGDVQILTAGTGLFGAMILAKVVDPARVAAAVGAVCGDLAQEAGVQVRALPTGCAIAVAPGWQRARLGYELPGFTVTASVQDQLLTIVIGDGDAAPLTAGAPTLAAPVTAQLWTRASDIDVPALPPGMVDGRTAGLLDGVSWIGGRIDELAATLVVTADRAAITVDVTTFASDPPDAREQYALAIGLRDADQGAASDTALAVLQRDYPGARIAARARREPTRPVVGPLLAWLMLTVAD